MNPLNKNDFRETSAIIILFDLSDKPSLIRAKELLSEASGFMRDNIPIFIIGNKIDKVELNQGLRVILYKEALKEFSSGHQFYYEYSSVTMKGREELLNALLKSINLKTKSSWTDVITKNGCRGCFN